MLAWHLDHADDQTLASIYTDRAPRLLRRDAERLTKKQLTRLEKLTK